MRYAYYLLQLFLQFTSKRVYLRRLQVGTRQLNVSFISIEIIFVARPSTFRIFW